jgi:hypothetical protein
MEWIEIGADSDMRTDRVEEQALENFEYNVKIGDWSV